MNQLPFSFVLSYLGGQAHTDLFDPHIHKSSVLIRMLWSLVISIPRDGHWESVELNLCCRNQQPPNNTNKDTYGQDCEHKTRAFPSHQSSSSITVLDNSAAPLFPHLCLSPRYAGKPWKGQCASIEYDTHDTRYTSQKRYNFS